MSSQRLDKLNTFIRKAFSTLLEKEVDLPLDIFCTITKVDTSSDFRYSTIFLSIYPENRVGSTLNIIRKNLPRLQKMLFTRSSLRIVPQLQISSDSTERKADIVEHLLNDIQKERLSSYDYDEASTKRDYLA
ncbi:MAG: 30S ribosome-binding factor RbfA [Candidatus Moranbacteria bacterium]|nr:30S ribosome-binding factor RbfA [Candidatus Moranbacteria bacterium]